MTTWKRIRTRHRNDHTEIEPCAQRGSHRGTASAVDDVQQQPRTPRVSPTVTAIKSPVRGRYPPASNDLQPALGGSFDGPRSAHSGIPVVVPVADQIPAESSAHERPTSRYRPVRSV